MNRAASSRFTRTSICSKAVTQVFDLPSFKRILLGGESGELHFQSVILRKQGRR